MRSHYSRALGFAVVILIGGIFSPSRLVVSGEQASSPYQWRGTVIQGGAIEIKGVNGAVKASAATGAEVERRTFESMWCSTEVVSRFARSIRARTHGQTSASPATAAG